jgi:large subunit ribosomal protein L3
LDDKAAGEFQLGQVVDVKSLENVMYVDVVGISKGKGTQGVMKRHNFKGMFASHGTERMHRHGGSIASHATNRGRGPKPKKGKRMPGRMGNERVTMRNLDVVSIDPEKNLLLVKGAVPGPNMGLLYIRQSIRLNRSKARKVAEAAK